MACRPLRVGVAGLGFGGAVHAPVLLGLSDVEVVGIAGRTYEKSLLVAEKLSIPRGCGSAQELLDLGLDAIFLALPPAQVFGAANEALSAKVAVFCEKPLGASFLESEILADNARDITTAVNFTFAELDVFTRLREIIEGGELGAVSHVNILWLTESWAQRTRAWSWKTDADSHGGVLSLFGSHILYLLEWLLGPIETLDARLLSVSTIAFTPLGARAAEDLVDCRFRHDSGSITSCMLGNASPGLTTHRWTVVLEGGSVILENVSSDHTAFRLSVLKPGIAQEFLVEPISEHDGRKRAFARLAQRFIEGVRNGSPIQPDFRSAARVQALDSAIRRSSSLNREIKVAHG